MRVFDRLERHALLGEDQLQPRRSLPQEEWKRRQHRRIQVGHAAPPGASAAQSTNSRAAGHPLKRKPALLGSREQVADAHLGKPSAEPPLQLPRPEPALAHRVAVGIHPETAALVDPLHRHARQPGPPRIPRAHVLVDDDERPPRPEHPPHLAAHVVERLAAPGARRPRRPSTPSKLAGPNGSRRADARTRSMPVASASIAAERSSPTTGAPRSAKRLANRPLPQPRSRMRRPASGDKLVDDRRAAADRPPPPRP